MPVKGDQTDIQPIDNDAQHCPGSRPFDDFQIFLTHPNGIKKAGQAYKSNQFHKKPDAIRGAQQVPMVALGYPDYLDNELTGENKGRRFAETQGNAIFFF